MLDVGTAVAVAGIAAAPQGRPSDIPDPRSASRSASTRPVRQASRGIPFDLPRAVRCRLDIPLDLPRAVRSLDLPLDIPQGLPFPVWWA